MNSVSDLINDDSSKKRTHDVPLEHLDFKYVEKCQDVKELEKIYRVLASGVEGKYPELEEFTFQKIKNLAPNSRALRKDLPIYSKSALPKTEQELLDNEISNFVKEIPNFEKKILSTKIDNFQVEKDSLPPVRSAQQKFLINPTKIEKSNNETKPLTNESSTKSKNKSVKPKDYREWEKIEKQIDQELNEKEEEENVSKEKESKKKEELTKVSTDKTVINQGKNLSKTLVKEIEKDIKLENLDEATRTLKANQEKCKGNEAFGSGCYQEALAYYTRSIKYLPNSASYNNRALTYIKLEEWGKAIDDCSQVLQYEKDNIKALLRRATALHKKKNYENAREDIKRCLSLDPNDKKAKELDVLIEKDFKNDLEEKEKVRSIGGNRLKIEETDGSDEEESDQQEKNNFKQVKIAEVETDETEEESEIEETNEEFEESIKNKRIEKEIEQKINTEPLTQKIELKLPEDLIQTKDKANQLFANGQYGEAIEYYSKSIDILKNLSSTSTKENLAEINKSLSVLYNNRASSLQHTCDYKSCINDCNTALELIEANPNEQLKLKLLFKKANALEMIEKYDEAFVTYEKLMKLDSKFKNVQINYNRVRNLLNETGKLNKIRSQVEEKNEKPEAIKFSEKKEEKQQTVEKQPTADIEKLYEEYKTKGNDFVKQNNYEKACEFYTKCIDLDGVNTLAYSNRSLCYVKLNQPDLAINDASFVLKVEHNNVKALYRRALAYKIKNNFDQAFQDLKNILKIEPNNQIAKNELKLVEDIINSLKKYESKSEEVNKKKSEEKKVLIKEIENENKTKFKEEKIPTKETLKKNVMSIPLVENIPNKIYNFSTITNAYEFLQAWNSINPKNIEAFSKLLSNVNPTDLHKFIGSKLDDDMLNKLIKSIHKLCFDSDLSKLVENKYSVSDYLKSIAKSQRFEVIKLFLSQELKHLLKEICASINESDIIKKLYSI